MREKELSDELEGLKGKIPWQTYSTISGQIRKGDMKGAAVGIERLKKRISKEDMDNADSSR